jgi:hypothetical protein
VIGLQYFSGTLADNGAGPSCCVVTRAMVRYARDGGSIGNTQVFDTIDFEIAAWALGPGLTVLFALVFINLPSPEDID